MVNHDIARQWSVAFCFLQPLGTLFVVQFVQDAPAFGHAVPAGRAGGAHGGPFRVAGHEVVVNVVHGLFDIGMELVPPHLAMVASNFAGRTGFEPTNVTRPHVVVAGAVLAQVIGEERIELQLTLFLLWLLIEKGKHARTKSVNK